jgi:glycyl-tRNA synthetase
MKDSPTLEQIIALAKRRGFVYPTSDIYGGLANAYDYGPLGTELMRNLKNLWWQRFIKEQPDMVGLDSQIILHPQTWVASGHVGNFNDPLVEDKVTHERFRADHLIEAYQKNHEKADQSPVENMTFDQMTEYIGQNKITSPAGNPITSPKAFNLLFESSLGIVSGEKSKVYLRGETAQGIFTNFKNVLDTTRVSLPFGIGQMGKSFRNEITQGQFIFRTFEFEQAEIEYFFDPDKTDWQTIFEQFKERMWSFVTQDLGISEKHLRWRRHSDKERSFYSKDTYDLEYEFPFGFKELWGIAYRTDYDLKQHQLSYRDPQTGLVMIPHVIEPALGLNRLLLMLLAEGYCLDADTNRNFLKLPAKVAPYTLAVFPLLKNKLELVSMARSLFAALSKQFPTAWDDRGNIGKRYYAQDEIGTPFCLTVDFTTLEDSTVTVRYRDTGKQERIKVDEISSFLSQHLN